VTASAFVAWVVGVVKRRIVVARIAGGIGGDPLFQFFHFQLNRFSLFHSLSPPFVKNLQAAYLRAAKLLLPTGTIARLGALVK
jgi:hypothetical protein